MTLSVQLEHNPNRLRFEEFPTALLDYQEESPKDDPSFVNLTVTDIKTNQTVTVFLKGIALQEAGISLTIWRNLSNDLRKLSVHIRNASRIERLLQQALPIVSEQLTPPYLPFFKKTAWANRLICCAIYTKKEHLSGIEGLPGIYLHFRESSTNVFINLKKTPPLGKGSWGKIRKCLWLNAPSNSPEIIAKKTMVGNELKYILCFEREMAALQEFSGKRGIISFIACGKYDGKHAIFMPLYECSLAELVCGYQLSLSLNESLSVISEWLDGLATISEKGIHGDVKPENLFLRRTDEGEMEGVIGDLGSYRPYDEAQLVNTSIAIEAPEFYSLKQVTRKYDSWGMGISLHEMFSVQSLPCWKLKTKDKMASWLSGLTPGWILQYPTRADTPPFLLDLINRMLDPRVEHRPTPKEAFECFSSGYCSFVDSS